MIKIKNFFAGISLFSLILMPATISFADNVSINDEINALKTRIAQLEKASMTSTTSCPPKVHAPSAGDGLVIGVASTVILQSTHNANGTAKKGEDATDSTYSLDISFSKATGDQGELFATIEAGHGAGLDGEEVLTFSPVNGDALAGNKKLDIAEIGYTQSFMDEKFIFTFGVLDSSAFLDTNALANCECSQFLNGAFINNTAIEFAADYSLGAVITADLNECFTLDLGAYEADSDFEDSSDKYLVFVQGTFKTQDGNYRLYAWNNGANHEELMDPTKKYESNSGIGISCDQQVSENIGLFLRYAKQDEAVSTIESSWSAGSSITGNLWNRSDDVLAMALGQNMPSNKYKDAGNPAEDETVFEVFYRWQANNNLAISPDIQVIWNPNGVDTELQGRNDTIIVAGIRAQLDF